MLVRGDQLGRSMSAYLVERIEANPMIDVRLGTQVVAVDGEDGRLSQITVQESGGRTERLAVKSLFLCLGGEPRTAWTAKGWSGDRPQRIHPHGPGPARPRSAPRRLAPGVRPARAQDLRARVFVAGDARHGSTKRVGGAVGEGAMAAALVHRRLDELEGLRPS